MEVIATKLGYYDLKRRKEGATFVLKSEKHFSKEWMEPVDGQAPKKKQEQKQKPKVVESSDTEVI
jgi:hypothetical protein